jgi:alpha-beta hydrolase superfamily lysophospholipase
MKLRFKAESGKAMIKIWDEAGNFHKPVLVLQGSDDVIVPPQAVNQLYEALAVQDKAFHLYDGFYHEIFNEIGKERVYADVDAWLLPRL